MRKLDVLFYFIIPRHISRARFSLFLKQLRYSCFQPYILLYFLFFPKPRGVQRSRVWFSGALGRGSLRCRTTCIFSVYHETCLVGTDGFFTTNKAYFCQYFCFFFCPSELHAAVLKRIGETQDTITLELHRIS
jgi:hypothetical protein